MNIKQYLRPLMLGLLYVILALGGSSLMVTAQESSTFAGPSPSALALKEQDPLGLVLTLTAVMVVFSALALLFLVFKGVGHIFQSIEKPKGAVSNPITASGQSQQHTKGRQIADNGLSPEALVSVSMALHNFQQERENEIMAAISIALRCELEQSHDNESFVLTISRKPTQWNARALGMRQQ